MKKMRSDTIYLTADRKRGENKWKLETVWKYCQEQSSDIPNSSSRESPVKPERVNMNSAGVKKRLVGV